MNSKTLFSQKMRSFFIIILYSLNLTCHYLFISCFFSFILSTRLNKADFNTCSNSIEAPTCSMSKTKQNRNYKVKQYCWLQNLRHAFNTSSNIVRQNVFVWTVSSISIIVAAVDASVRCNKKELVIYFFKPDGVCSAKLPSSNVGMHFCTLRCYRFSLWRKFW